MRLLPTLFVRLLVLCSFCSIAHGAVAPGGPWFNPPLSERVVSYRIDARYDAKAHSLEGTETLTYTNRTGQPLQRFPFHLYLNAFQPKSTWMREAHENGQRDVSAGSGWDDKEFGSNEIKSFKVSGTDLTSKLKFISPDDGNPNDRTVVEIELPRPVPPNGTVTFEIAFKAKFPEVVARTGYKRDFLLAGQWFPKVGVWWNGAWNCHQFHTATEFFADYGTYDVNITLPQNFTFGSTGLVSAEKKNPDGTKTITAHAEDVHDFAWMADPTVKVVEDSVRLSSGDVKIRMLMQPAHMASAPRYLQALKGTMQKMDEWYGPYPYPQVTLVDPPHGGLAAGGMEYPMFFTADTTWWMPKSILLPELVTQHEYGHEYWYGMVGSNEFEDAWLDEGINSYTEVKVMDALYGSTTSVANSRLFSGGDRGMQRWQYTGVRDFDPLSANAWQFVSYASYGGNTYGKSATLLLTLEHVIGEDTLRKALRTYFMRFRFKHPTEADFMNTVSEVAGQDLKWFWDQAINGTQVLDYRIYDVKSQRTNWYEKVRPGANPKDTLYDSAVVVHRKGDFIFPVTLEVKFDNGEVVREQWDGRDRWKRFTWQKKAKIVSAQVDPDDAVLLDIDQFNNSYIVGGNSRATAKIATYVMWITQWFAQMISWLA